MFRKALVILATLAFSVTANSADGLIKMKSAHSVDDTVNKLETVLESKGMNIFGRVNHAAGADKAGLELQPTQVLIFGNPKVGTPLMQCARSVAIDLPQKALVWEDEAGEVWLAYNDPAWLASRHEISGCDAVLQKVSGALSNFAAAATAK